MSTGLAAEVYKTKDKNGNVVYTDNPEGAEKVELRDINSVPRPQYIPGAQAPLNSAPPQMPGYELRIVSPRNNLVIPVGQRDLAIAVALQPALRAGDLLVYYLDGELLEESTSTSIQVRDLARGVHQISVEIMDERGQSLGTAESVSVSLMGPHPPKPASP